MSKRFTQQFKDEAVKLVADGRSIREVAGSLGVGLSSLDKWVRAWRDKQGLSGQPALSAEQKRVRELEKEVAHLREVNEVLKKATVYFANHPSR